MNVRQKQDGRFFVIYTSNRVHMNYKKIKSAEMFSTTFRTGKEKIETQWIQSKTNNSYWIKGT